MNNKEFFAIFGLLVGFGFLLLVSLYLFGESQYLLLAIIAQVLILGNLILWRWFFQKTFFQNLIKKPLFLFFFYFFKVGLILLVLVVSMKIIF